MNKQYEIENIITMVGCNRNEFMTILESAKGKINLSSGSYYSDFIILDDEGVLAKYDYKGKLINKRN